MFTLLFTFLPKIMLFNIKFVKKRIYLCSVEQFPPHVPSSYKKWSISLYFVYHFDQPQKKNSSLLLCHRRLLFFKSNKRNFHSSVPFDRRFCGITVNDFGIFDRIDDAELSVAKSADIAALLLLFNCSAHCHMVVGVVVT